MGFVAMVRGALLLAAALWSLSLAWKIARLETQSVVRRVAAVISIGGAVAIGVASWGVLFWVW